jgi:hypothetical protein
MKKNRTSSQSTYAVNDLIGAMTGKRDTGYYSGMATVSADVNGSTVVDHQDIEVTVTFDGTNYATINIFWEESGFKNYRILGLYGQMNTQYQEAYFVKPRGLKICGDSYVIRFQYKPN